MFNLPFEASRRTKIVSIGDRDHGSEAKVLNGHRFSYPGYSEILTGGPQDSLIDSNDLKPNPLHVTLYPTGTTPAAPAATTDGE